MNTGVLVLIGVIVLFIIYQVDKNSKMMKYRKLYEEALREKNKQKVLQYGRLYHRYRTGSSAIDTSAAELAISNDMKAAGIN